MGAASLFGRSVAPDSSILWTDSLHHFSIKIENQTLDHLGAELRSRSCFSTSGVLLGTVRHENGWTRIEVGACLLLRSGLLLSTSGHQDERALAVELRNYPPATPRSPGCVGYFSIGAIGQSQPTAAEHELFSHRLTDNSQVFLFARRSETGQLSPQFFTKHDRTLVPVPLYVKPAANFVISNRRVWAVCAALIGIFVVSGMLYSNRPRGPIATTARERFTIIPKFSESHPFQLAISREAGSLKLSWDGQASAVRSAQKGILVIEDGERYSEQNLDSADLRNGQLTYVPAGSSSSGNIRFRMDLVSETGAVQSASVRVLGMAPKTVAKVAVVSPPVDADIVRTRVATPVRSQPDNLPAQSATAVAPSPSPTVPVASPPITASAKPLPLIEPQSIERPPATAPEVRPSPAASAVSEAPARFSITQVTHEPKVKRSVKPSIPLGLQSMLRSRSRTPIVIPVKVRIDPFGEVTVAQADYPQVSVFEKQLVNLVQTTARYWTFDPATINGKPVASELVINFKF